MFTRPVRLGECPEAQKILTLSGGFSGVRSHLVLGEERFTRVVAGTTVAPGVPGVIFTAEALIGRVPSREGVGIPLIVVSGRGQPRNENRVSLEAYAAGAETVPIQVSIVAIQENFEVVSCGSNKFCTRPLGTYTARRLNPSDPVAGCQPGTCGGGTLNERAEVRFVGPGIDTTVTEADDQGFFSFSPRMPAAPGSHVIDVEVSSWLAVPDRPDSADPLSSEVVPCAGGCGAAMKLAPSSDSLSYMMWTVEGKIVEPTPLVILGHANRHEEFSQFAYTLEPETYPALRTSVLFHEDGVVPVTATADGRGAGVAILPVGEQFTNPQGAPRCTGRRQLRVDLESESGESCIDGNRGDRTPFQIFKFDVDVDSNNSDGLNLPQQDDLEDRIEDYPDHVTTGLGKIVLVNNDDQDNDKITDFADGYNRDPTPANVADDVNAAERFVPIVLELAGTDINNARIRFMYDVSYPQLVVSAPPIPNWPEFLEYEPAPVGRLRIWTEPGNVQRDIAAVPAGHLVYPGIELTAADLGFSPGTSIRTLYLEAVQPSDVELGERIRVEVDPDGGGPLGFDVREAVRVTSVEVQLQDELNTVRGGEVAWIDNPGGNPQMPQLTARLRPTISNPTELKWRLETRYARGAPSFQVDTVHVPGPGNTDRKDLTTSDTWSLMNDFPPPDSNDSGGYLFFGGEAVLHGQLSLDSDILFNFELPFRIRGQNPDDPTARVFISANDLGYDFAYAIARHETNDEGGPIYNQFTESGEKGTPKHGAIPAAGDDGWGMFQLDLTEVSGSVPIHHLWNWQANVVRGAQTISDKAAIADNWLNSLMSHPSLIGLPVGQRGQARVQAGNGMYISGKIVGGMPIHPSPATEANCTFDDTAARNCENGDCTFDDAVTIKAYNGANVHYISWDSTNLRWNVNSTNNAGRNYVFVVCNHIGQNP